MGSPRCVEPAFLLLTPPTIFVPYAIACSVWKVPYFCADNFRRSITYVLAGHTLADYLGVSVNEDFRLVTGLVATGRESEELLLGSESLDCFI